MVTQPLKNVERLDIKKYVLFYVDSTKEKGIDDIAAEEKLLPFNVMTRQKAGQATVWSKFSINNTSVDTLQAVLFLGYHIFVEMYEISGTPSFDGGLQKVDLTQSVDKFSAKLLVLPNRKMTYWVKLSPFLYFRRYNPLLFSIDKYRFFRRYHSDSSIYRFGYRTMFMGLCFFLGLIAFVQSIYNRDKTHFFWALYLWSNFAYFLTGLDRHFDLGVFGENIRPWMIVTQYPIQITYLLFINSFLGIKKYDPATYRIILIAVVVLLFGSVVSFYAVANRISALRDLSEQFTFITDLAVLFLFIRVVRKGIPQTKLLIIGSLGLLAAAVIAAIVDQLDLTQFDVFWFSPVVIFSIGFCFELIFFSLALSQRTQIIKAENEQLQRDYTKKIEIELADRIQVIQTQNHLLEEQRVQQLTGEFEQKIAEAEISALRSQMNPHFIFNCLNSIKLYMLENNAEAASDYLTKFSLLIRSVLDNSRSEKITLENELNTLKLYAEMETMRFKNKLKFILNVEKGIDLLFVEIPPLLLQPFIENAIWHGLMHKDEGGTVHVNLTKSGEKTLRIEIIDDGVGRQKSVELKSKNATRKKSYGMKVTGERIDLINQMYKIKTRCEVIDLYGSKGEPIGTKVVLDIPI